MKRRMSVAPGRSLFGAAFFLMLIPGVFGAQDISQIKVTIDKVADRVFMITGAGGNIGVLTGPDGIVLVDSQFGQIHDKVAAAVASVDKGPVRFVLNTNWHYDHALGNEAFHKAGAVIIAQENGAARMTRDQIHEVIDGKTEAYPAAARPEVTFSEALTLRLDGEEVEALHFSNAHSDTDALYHFKKANVVHTGDLLFSAGYPYIDIGNGGSINGMIAAADRILAMTNEATKFIPGHGPLADRVRLAAYRAMLAGIRDGVKKLIAEGKSEAEAVAAKPTAAFDQDWKYGMSPAQFTMLVYRSLKR